MFGVGSLVESDRLRFDFSHFEAVSQDQLQAIEKLSNEKLLLNETVKSYEIPFSEKPEGVIAFLETSTGSLFALLISGWSQELLRWHLCVGSGRDWFDQDNFRVCHFSWSSAD